MDPQGHGNELSVSKLCGEFLDQRDNYNTPKK